MSERLHVRGRRRAGVVGILLAALAGVTAAAGASTAAGAASAATLPPAMLDSVSCLSPTDCTAVGSYDTTAGTATKALAEHWDGASWALEPTPDRSDASATELSGVSCPSTTRCVAVGSYTLSGTKVPTAFAETWDGASWKLQWVPEPATASYSALSGVSCTSPTACTAVGHFWDGKASDVVLRALVAIWNGTKWTNESPPNGIGGSDLLSVSCTAAMSCTATGYQNTGVNFMFAEASAGTNWTVTLKKQTLGGHLTAVSCVAASSCVGVGNNQPGKPVSQTWNGTAWTVEKMTPVHENLAVSCTSSTLCTAVGAFGTAAGSPAWAGTWDGTAWANHATPSQPGWYGTLAGVSCTEPTACIAVGYETTVGGELREPLAESWNGTTWALQSAPG